MFSHFNHRSIAFNMLFHQVVFDQKYIILLCRSSVFRQSCEEWGPCVVWLVV